MKKSKKAGMHTRRFPYYFEHDGFDFMFQWILGMHTNGGSEVGEAFYVASRIKDGNCEDWIREWTDLAIRIEKRAEMSLQRGHEISAKYLFFRGYTYYRAALMFMSPIKDSRYFETYNKARSLFNKAIDFDVKIDRITIEYNNVLIQGYYLENTDKDNNPNHLVMIGGGDTFVEDLYYYIGPQGQERGYNIVLLDMPGQGILPMDELYFQPNTEIFMEMALNQLVEKYQIDNGKTAIFGISAGGYFAPRASTKTNRINACIACNALPDFSLVWKNTVTKKIAKLEDKPIYNVLKKIPKIKSVLMLLDTYKWRFGVVTLTELIEKSEDFVFNPSEITCPVLNIIGESEYEAVAYREGWESFVNDSSGKVKTTVVSPLDEGLDGHGLGTNVSTMCQIVFDWLDEVFDK